MTIPVFKIVDVGTGPTGADGADGATGPTGPGVGSTGYITAHHVMSWVNHKMLRHNINNGLTLCEECHSMADNYRAHKRKITA